MVSITTILSKMMRAILNPGLRTGAGFGKGLMSLRMMSLFAVFFSFFYDFGTVSNFCLICLLIYFLHFISVMNYTSVNFDLNSFY